MSSDRRTTEMKKAEFGDVHGFCPRCGQPLVFGSRAGRGHPVCGNCGYVRYRNPAVGVAVVLQDEDGRVLMGRRARGDYAGHWCIPCGYVEWDEEVRASAVREFEEETGLAVEARDVVAVHSNFHNRDKQTVGIWFRGQLVGGELHPADGEFTELGWFDPAEPPVLAFPTDALVLEQLARERSNQD
jgi:8-oxo-dGTP diphosphatase